MRLTNLRIGDTVSNVLEVKPEATYIVSGIVVERGQLSIFVIGFEKTEGEKHKTNCAEKLIFESEPTYKTLSILSKGI